jgi:glycosyltransferase involved in cell wall biosynthesis
MKASLMNRYKICEDKISVVHHGLNFSVPITQLSQRAARSQIGIDPQSHALLIFGRITPYKGIDIAFQSLKKLSNSTERFILLVAGGVGNNDRAYLKALMDYVHKENISHMLKFYTDFIPDNDIELFFKSAASTIHKR